MTDTSEEAMTDWELELDPEQLTALRQARSRIPFAETGHVAARAAALELIQSQGQPVVPDVWAVHDAVATAGHGAPVPVRVYAPAASANAALIHVHGGGFVFGSVATVDGYARALANGTGRTVVSVDYRLAPEHPYPAALDDCDTVFDWVLQGGLADVDLAHVALHGVSAGANLVAGLCLRRRDLGKSLPQAQVLVVPCVDPALDSESCFELDKSATLSRDNLRWLWHQYLGDAEPDAYAAMVRTDSCAGLPPALVATAEHDTLRDEGERYAELLAQAGVPVRAVRYPKTIHGFTALLDLPQSRTLMSETAQFLASLDQSA